MIIKRPYLQRAEQDSITIMWQTDHESEGKVFVYPTDNPRVPVKYPPISDSPIEIFSSANTLHKVRVEGLLPGCTYAYEVEVTEGNYKTSCGKSIFRTAPESDAAVKFVLIAEHGGLGNRQLPNTAPLVEQIRREHPDFILSVGDLCCNGRTEYDWNFYVFNPLERLLKNTPLYPCVGNHELWQGYISCEEDYKAYDLFHKYYDFNRYYSFDYGCAHFCVLDAPEMYTAITSDEKDGYIPVLRKDLATCDQIKFMEEDLAKSTARWNFVVFHFPPYTSAVWDDRELQEAICPIIEKYNVDIVFNSHAIVYERSHPIRGGKIVKDGIRYILIGGFEDCEHWLREKSNGYAAKIAGHPNFVHVAVSPWRFELQAIDKNGNVFDTLTIDKE